MLEKLQAVASRYEELCAKAEQPDFTPTRPGPPS